VYCFAVNCKSTVHAFVKDHPGMRRYGEGLQAHLHQPPSGSGQPMAARQLRPMGAWKRRRAFVVATRPSGSAGLAWTRQWGPQAARANSRYATLAIAHEELQTVSEISPRGVFVTSQGSSSYTSGGIYSVDSITNSGVGANATIGRNNAVTGHVKCACHQTPMIILWSEYSRAAWSVQTP